MLDKLFREKEEETLRRTKRNQEMHTRFVEEAKREKLYVNSKGYQRFPNKFNKGYAYKK